MLWVSRSQRKTLIQDGGTKSCFSNLLLKLFDVWTDLSHFSPWKCCFYNGYTSCKYYSIYFAVFLCKKVAFITILTASLKIHRNRPKLAIFFIFSPGWSMESLPIHYQSASYNSQTSEEYQLHSKPLSHGGIRSYISSKRKISLFCSFVACNCIPIWGYLQENDGQNHK